MRKKTCLLYLALFLAGCQGNNSATVETAPKETAPAYQTKGLEYFGFPFGKPVHYKAVGLPQGTAEGDRTIKTVVQDGKLMITATWSGGLAALDSETDVADADGLHNTSTGNNRFDPPLLQLPANPKEGDSWKSNYEVKIPSGTFRANTTSKVLGIKKVTVPLGTFDAMVVRETGTLASGSLTMDVTSSVWFVKGVGLVKNSLQTSIHGSQTSNTITIEAIPAK
ncbi:MAG TPA: hypothetical protein VFG65_07400 [Fimbriimonadales bacterium]|jgi:hypothetical protein|nr:hypothetical protein [Fimbriimonadales bacterium]